MAEGQYTSTERVYVDKDGKRVDAKDPKRHTLLVAEGGQIPMERARAAGLLDEESDEAPDGTEEKGSEDAIDAQEESARIQGKKSAKKAKK